MALERSGLRSGRVFLAPGISSGQGPKRWHDSCRGAIPEQLHVVTYYLTKTLDLVWWNTKSRDARIEPAFLDNGGVASVDLGSRNPQSGCMQNTRCLATIEKPEWPDPVIVEYGSACERAMEKAISHNDPFQRACSHYHTLTHIAFTLARTGVQS